MKARVVLSTRISFYPPALTVSRGLSPSKAFLFLQAKAPQGLPSTGTVNSSHPAKEEGFLATFSLFLYQL